MALSQRARFATWVPGTMLVASLMLSGCQSAYYDVMEQAGVHKRDILSDRVIAARDAQQDADEQFSSALERYQSVVTVPESELSRAHAALESDYARSQAAADRVSQRIDAIESVAQALFKEWEGELDQYQNETYRRQSERELEQTRQRYGEMLDAMHRAEDTMPPVLTAMHDNVLFLKHNLNARAIGALKGEVSQLETQVAALRREMQASIERSNRFIDGMESTD
ncbi:DUF2959 domain-containing protein [Kushneria pakistanensis]|uniref:DUF2959 domain-containing protein n=1 Tax=Kushneria pakistanensis TaxID=1508770 RepID=A0ABQ3F961_9GAMM|nr:DUF2959 domain-containing protein [Kushneria pakistanensis]GHC14525.1 DUF2959 domain-containing protein [Kushneria pakistanensis]